MTGETRQLVTASVGGQRFGIAVGKVRDVLGPQRIMRVPLAPAHVAGSLNLRGRIVTALDLRVPLSLPPGGDPSQRMSIVIEYGDDLYSILVDEVGEVLQPERASWEPLPATLSDSWRQLCDGLFRLDGELLLVLEVDRLVAGPAAVAA